MCVRDLYPISSPTQPFVRNASKLAGHSLLLSLMWPKPTLLTNFSQISIHQKWIHYQKCWNKTKTEMLLNRIPYLKCDIQLSDTKCVHPKQKLCCRQGYVKSRVLSKTVIWVFLVETFYFLIFISFEENKSFYLQILLE